jgi:hypothetical protein
MVLVGTITLDSLGCAATGGAICMAGMVGDAWEYRRFSPIDVIPSTVNLATYSGGAGDFVSTPLQEIIEEVEAGQFKPPLGKAFGIDHIVTVT